MAEPDTSTTVDGTILQLKSLVKNKRFDQVESLWLSYLERDTFDVHALLRIARDMVRVKKEELTGTLLWATIDALREKVTGEVLLAIARQAAVLVPRDGELQSELAALVEKVHADDPNIQALLEMAGLGGDAPSDRAVEQLDMILALTPGRYVYDRKVHRPGRVEGLKPEEGRFIVDLVAYPSKYTPKTAVERLELLPPDDFRALAAFEKERMTELAGDDPVALVRLVLQANGGRLEHRKLKEILTEADVLPKSWTAWYAKAKTPLRRAADLHVSEEAQPYYVLRQQEVNYEDEVRDRFGRTDTVATAAEVVLGYLDESRKEHPLDPDLALELAQGLLERASQRVAESPAGALAHLAVRHRIASEVDGLPPVPEELLAASLEAAGRAAESVSAIGYEPAVRAWLDFVHEHDEDWPTAFADVLPVAGYAVCGEIADRLAEAEAWDAMREAAELAHRQPAFYPEAFIWLWRAVCGGRYGPALGEMDPGEVTVGLVDLSEQIYRSRKRLSEKESRRLLVQMRTVVGAQSYKLVHEVIGNLDADRAVALREALERNDGLDDKVRAAMITHTIRKHGALVTEKVEMWEEDVIYTTRAGLDKHQAALDHVLNVEIPDNADQIGKAASYGDLSENAEFTAALEARDRLTEKVDRLKADLVRARVLHFDMVPVDRVTVGTKVTVKRSDGQQREMTFLGPWDSDPDQGIYYYRADLCMALMGHVVGDSVTASTGEGNTYTYDILAITLADQ